MIPPTDKTGSLRSERRRDNQQWLLDWMVKTTGRTHNFAYDHCVKETRMVLARACF
jgi:hypothetical protein